jgi:hypothetical protein
MSCDSLSDEQVATLYALLNDGAGTKLFAETLAIVRALDRAHPPLPKRTPPTL